MYPRNSALYSPYEVWTYPQPVKIRVLGYEAHIDVLKEERKGKLDL